jgi:anti-sigma factor RsiW
MKLMKCKDARRRIVALAGGQPAGPGDLDGHLRQCPECRHLLDDLRSDTTLLRREEEPVVPDFFTTRVMARVRAPAGLPGRGFAPSARLAAAAVLLLVAVGLWLGAALGRAIFGQDEWYRDRAAVTTCGVSPDGFLEGFFGE